MTNRMSSISNKTQNARFYQSEPSPSMVSEAIDLQVIKKCKR